MISHSRILAFVDSHLQYLADGAPKRVLMPDDVIEDVKARIANAERPEDIFTAPQEHVC